MARNGGFFVTTALVALLSFFIDHVRCLGATDTITWGGDNSRTGYQTNHNMDPAIVNSSDFGQIFATKLPGTYLGKAEQIFSQPLVYTLSDGIQYLFFATTQNNVYKLNAATGAIVAKRNLHIPFMITDLDGCGDINPFIGVTATGVIDPTTDTYYLTSKTYLDQNAGPVAQGRPNGRYYFHAIDVNDLSERPGFPVNLEGAVARNNPRRWFNAGVHHQRPGLLLTGQYVYAGFASHCVKFNYTGWIMGWDKTTGAIIERYAMEGAPVDDQTQGGGVWMSGGGLASDDAGSIFFATGNGHASQLDIVPVNGRNPPSALEEAAVHMTINADGTLNVVDFFMPWDKRYLDGGDIDLGTSPLEILPKEFACGSIRRIGVVTGKSGKTYWLNLDDMGGYQNGPNGLDKVIQVTQNENSVYAGAGVYPLEGGYVYINVIKYPTHVFKFNCANGVPSFTQVADTPEVCAYLGVSHGTTTSLNGQPGTGLFWVSDVNGYNLRIYNAVPKDGTMTLINHFQIQSVSKFTRPVFGDGRAYIGTTNGIMYGFGSNVNLALNCTAIDFGSVDISSGSVNQTVSCKAKVAVKVNTINVKTVGDFTASGLPVMPLTVLAGNGFTFQASFDPSTVGDLNTNVVIATTNGVAGYSSTTSVSLRGKGQSESPILSISPATVEIKGITGEQVGGIDETTLFKNSGDSALTITSIEYSTNVAGPFQTTTNFANFPKVGKFTFKDIPSTIIANGVSTITVNFDTAVTGTFEAYLIVHSNGGTANLKVTGISGGPPIALFEFQSIDGFSWIPYSSTKNFTFGNVTENQTRFLQMRVTNTAGPDGVALSLAVSKPPGGGNVIAANNMVDLGEGTTLEPGQSATATVYCSVPKRQWNTASFLATNHWSINVNDLKFGYQNIQFVCNAIAEQAPPLLPNGDGQYVYAGCFKENNPNRQLAKQIYGDDTNTIQKCIAACAAGKYKYCGTQYGRECWGGPNIPILKVGDGNCNFDCKGDVNQVCGGNGVGEGEGKGPYISLFVDSAQGGNSTAPVTPPGGPVVNPGVGGYGSIGCYTEATTGRALPNGKTITTKTVASCVTACSASNYKYAGLEYGGECWCGNAFGAGSVPTVITQCSMVCKNNATEYCGAGQRLNVYERGVVVSSSSTGFSSSVSTISPSSTLSMISTSSTSSITSTNSVPTSSFSPLSTSTSTSAPSLSSGSLSSSSSTLSSTSTFSSTSSTSSTSSVPSSSNTSQSSSSSSGTSASSMSTTASSSMTSSISLTTTTSQPSSTSGPSGTSTSTSSSSKSQSSAISSSSLSSISSSSSSSLLTSSISLSSSTGSSTTTTTTTTTTSSTSTVPQPTYTGPPVTSPGNTNFTYTSCIREPSKGRLLTKIESHVNVTVSRCLEKCWMYKWAGLEYGKECWCGNTLNLAGSAGATPAVNVTDKECNVKCAGNISEFCGAGSRMNLYVLKY